MKTLQGRLVSGRRALAVLSAMCAFRRFAETPDHKDGAGGSLAENLKAGNASGGFKFGALVALSMMVLSLGARADATIDDYLFRHDFTSGGWVFTGSDGQTTDPAASGKRAVLAHGPNGGLAAQPIGSGTITDGNTLLNADWTMAMSFKSTSVEKGVILSLGSNGTEEKKQIAICSSSTPGRLHVAVVQYYSNNGGKGKNVPKYINLDGLGDLTGEFHSLVAIHRKGENATGVVTFYLDGSQVGTFDSFDSSPTRPFANGIQYCGLHGGEAAGYKNMDSNPDIAFQDSRFFTRALSDDEIALYVAAFPAEKVQSYEIGDFYFRYGFDNGVKTYGNDGCPDDPVASTYGQTVLPCTTESHGAVVHPVGKGTFKDGQTLLNGDWTMALSVKSCPVEKGVLFSLGTTSEKAYSRQLLFCSSSTSGKMHLAICQRWNADGGDKNTPSTIDVSGIGDTINAFHTIVAAYTKSDNMINIYCDGVFRAQLNSLKDIGSDKIFRNGLQFCSAHNDNLPSGYSDMSGNLDVAFLDARFVTNAWTQTEATLYAQAFPVTPVVSATSDASIDDFHFRHNFSSGKLVVEGEGFNENSNAAMAGSGTAMVGPDGDGTATFPNQSAGPGSIKDGLDRDWTLAMSVKPGSLTNHGVMLAMGGTGTSGQKGLAVCTTSSKGYLYFSNPQNYGSGKNTANSCALSVSGDTIDTFHSLIVVYSRNLKAGSNAARTDWVSGVFSFYWDGTYIGYLTTNDSFNRPLANQMQYGSIAGGNPSNYTTLNNVSCKEAFQDVRFYTYAWTSVEAARYAARYPARLVAAVWKNTAGDGSFGNVANWSTGALPKDGQVADVSAADATSLSVDGTYNLGTVRISGGGAVTVSGTGTISADNVTVAADTTLVPGGRMTISSLTLESGATFMLDTGDADGLSVENLVFNGGAYKPNGTGYLMVSGTISGPVVVRVDGNTNWTTPLFKTASEEALPSVESIVVTGASRKLRRAKEGYGYDLVKPGFLILFR